MAIEFLKTDWSQPTWLRLKEYYEGRLAALRMKNDAVMSPEDTARLRGRIKEIKLLLALPEGRAAPVDEADDA